MGQFHARRASCSSALIPFEHRLAPFIDTDRAPLRAVHRERRKQIGELGIPTILPDEALHVVLVLLTKPPRNLRVAPEWWLLHHDVPGAV
jgi:hypothetical protein